MQTFLPFADFAQSMRCLDWRRLGKQRAEAKQVVKALLKAGMGRKYGWTRHTAVRMWAGHELAVIQYGTAACDEWIRRGYRDRTRRWFTKVQKLIASKWTPERIDAASKIPAWVSDPAFNEAHRSNLIRKLPEHYSPQFPGTVAGLPYVWPTSG